jgi:hypothetical protein
LAFELLGVGASSELLAIELWAELTGALSDTDTDTVLARGFGTPYFWANFENISGSRPLYLSIVAATSPTLFGL